jgi:hypothetical protein
MWRLAKTRDRPGAVVFAAAQIAAAQQPLMREAILEQDAMRR